MADTERSAAVDSFAEALVCLESPRMGLLPANTPISSLEIDLLIFWVIESFEMTIKVTGARQGSRSEGAKVKLIMSKFSLPLGPCQEGTLMCKHKDRQEPPP